MKPHVSVASISLSLSLGLGMLGGTPAQASQVNSAKASSSTSASSKAQSSLPKGFLGGVIEGYYGPPWSVSDTVQMIHFIGQHHMNTYVYAPKNDPYQRDKWRTPYPASGLTHLKTLIAAAKNSGVTFVYSISPGLTITYSDMNDRDKLLAKIDELRSLGVNVFMLSLDDIYHGLYGKDKVQYNNDMAYAQSDLANWIVEQETKKDPQFRLIMTPTKYYGMTDLSYWDSLKKYLTQSVDVVWTGPSVLSTEITASQAETVSGYIGHKLIIWDNYPVNDYTFILDKQPKLYLGPVEGRSSDLIGAIDGYLFNPMQESRASEIALWTGGDYLSNPTGYRAQDSWLQAIHAIGGKAWKTFELFVEDSSSYYRGNQPPRKLQADVNVFWKLPESANLLHSDAYRDFIAMRAVNPILSKRLPDKKLYQEIKPWSQLLSNQGTLGMAAVQMLEAYRRHSSYTPANVARVKNLLASIQKDNYWIAGDVAQTFAQQALAKVNP